MVEHQRLLACTGQVHGAGTRKCVRRLFVHRCTCLLIASLGSAPTLLMTTILFIQCTCCRIRDQEDKTPPLQFRVQASRGGRGGTACWPSPWAEARLRPSRCDSGQASALSVPPCLYPRSGDPGRAASGDCRVDGVNPHASAPGLCGVCTPLSPSSALTSPPLPPPPPNSPHATSSLCHASQGWSLSVFVVVSPLLRPFSHWFLERVGGRNRVASGYGRGSRKKEKERNIRVRETHQ